MEMNDWVNFTNERFLNYVNSFKNLSAEQTKNFIIKKNHSLRVAKQCLFLATKLDLNDNDRKLVYATGLFHDVGRFRQLVEYHTFHDTKSVDHAELSLQVIQEENFLDVLNENQKQLVFMAIRLHNKFMLPKNLSEDENLFSKILRDADKTDIFRVITDYYTNKKAEPNHTLTWELPKSNSVSASVLKEINNEKLVSKENVKSDVDVKIMQLSWVYDVNFTPSFELILKERFLEKIYSTLPKNDGIIEIYRKVKMFTENKVLNHAKNNSGFNAKT